MQKKPSNRSFGLLFSFVFILITFWPLIISEPIRVWALITSLIFLILGLLDSRFLSPLNKYWIKLGELLGRIIAPLVMMLIFFTILTPIGLTLKLFGKDLLKIKKIKSLKSYWITKKKINSMDRQF